MSLTSTIILSSYPYQYKIDYSRPNKQFEIEFVNPQYPEEETTDFKDSKGVVNFIKENLKSWFVATLISYKSNCRHNDISKGSIVDCQTFTSANDNGFKEFIEQLTLKQYRDTAYDGYCDDFSEDDEEEEDKNDDNEDDDDENDNDNNNNNKEKNGKYNKDDIYDNEEFNKWQGSLAVYFTNNIYDKMEPVDCYPKSYSNEIELGTGDNDYRLYFYVYNRNKNCLLLSEGTGDKECYSEHSQLLDFLEEEFGSPFKCIDFENKKVYERKDSVTVESNLLH